MACTSDPNQRPSFISLKDLDNLPELSDHQRGLLAIGRMFIEMEQSFTYAVQRYADRHKLTVFEARALQVIYELGEGARLSVIAERIMAPLSTMTGIASRLEEQGLVERRRAPEDGRASILQLTPAGIERAKAFFTEMYGDMGVIVESLGEEAINAIAQGFKYANQVTAEFEEFARNKGRNS